MSSKTVNHIQTLARIHFIFFGGDFPKSEVTCVFTAGILTFTTIQAADIKVQLENKTVLSYMVRLCHSICCPPQRWACFSRALPHSAVTFPALSVQVSDVWQPPFFFFLLQCCKV